MQYLQVSLASIYELSIFYLYYFWYFCYMMICYDLTHSSRDDKFAICTQNLENHGGLWRKIMPYPLLLRCRINIKSHLYRYIDKLLKIFCASVCHVMFYILRICFLSYTSRFCLMNPPFHNWLLILCHNTMWEYIWRHCIWLLLDLWNIFIKRNWESLNLPSLQCDSPMWPFGLLSLEPFCEIQCMNFCCHNTRWAGFTPQGHLFNANTANW